MGSIPVLDLNAGSHALWATDGELCENSFQRFALEETPAPAEMAET